MIYIENEGAIFKGASRSFPVEVWDEREKKWAPYTGKVPKPIEWGHIITEAEAVKLIEEAAGETPRTIGEDMEIDPWKYDDYDGGRTEPRPDALAHLALRARKKAEAEATKAATGKDYGTA